MPQMGSRQAMWMWIYNTRNSRIAFKGLNQFVQTSSQTSSHRGIGPDRGFGGEYLIEALDIGYIGSRDASHTAPGHIADLFC